MLAQEVVSFVSEWRAYVLRREILGIGNYKGDPLVFPDGDRVRAIVAAYGNPAAAHSVDVGVTPAGETLLVEMNNAYALGNYCLPPVRFARLLEARWDEMCRPAA